MESGGRGDQWVLPPLALRVFEHPVRFGSFKMKQLFYKTRRAFQPGIGDSVFLHLSFPFYALAGDLGFMKRHRCHAETMEPNVTAAENAPRNTELASMVLAHLTLLTALFPYIDLSSFIRQL